MVRDVHYMEFGKDEHGVVRMKYKGGDHIKKASDYDTWKGPKVDQQDPLDLNLLLSNAWHQSTTETSNPTTEPEPELETIADGRNVKVQDLPVDIPKITKRCEQEARRVEDITFW
eukprot:gene12429-14685_t